MEDRQATIQHFKESWKALLWTGIILVVLGVMFLAVPAIAGIAVVTFLGVLLLIAGVVGALHAVQAKHKGWGINLVTALLAVACGGLLVADPANGMVGLTLLIALFLMFSGAFRFFYALQIKPHDGWGIVAVNGVISFVLGLLVYGGWPNSSNYVIGMFLGIDALFAGFSYVGLAMAAKNMA